MNRKSKVVNYCSVAVFVVALVAAFNSNRVFAGKSNLDTGEQCWGTGCIETDKELPSTSGTGSESSSSSAFLPGNITTPDCSDADREEIASAVNWLEHNLTLITPRWKSQTI